MKRLKTMSNRFLPILLAAVMLLRMIPLSASAAEGSRLDGMSKQQISDLMAQYIEDVINARKTNEALGQGGTYLGENDSILGSYAMLADASSTWTDWIALSIGRYGYMGSDGKVEFLYDDGDGYLDYLQAMYQNMTDRYASNSGKLDNNKATEWARAILPIGALGGD
ncbi:MAG: hypothetical protein LBQ68_06915, partial [Clostridiales bacterium]|nr:hypothetical protein [Clostridiales bacterium]